MPRSTSAAPRDDFAPGERVVFVEDGTPGTVHVSKGGYSHVYWDDEPELGGSRVASTELRGERNRLGFKR